MAQNASPAGRPLIDFDAASFHPKKTMAVTHRLADHPLLEIPSLLELSRRMKPPGVMNYFSGKASVDADFESALRTHGTGRSLEETLEHIEEPGSWVGFYHIESDPIYRELLDACLDDVQPRIEPLDPGMFRREAWIFFSSPGAITPYHIDTENNFLLQIRGRKTLSVWDPYDRSVISEEAIETYLADHSLREVHYREEIAGKAHTYKLEPGQGAYMPATGPHSASTSADSYSVTLSVTYYTRATEWRRTVYQANFALRKRGVKPRPVGASSMGDGLKYNAYRLYDYGKKVLRGSHHFASA
jgi:hypothetical protein